MLVVSIANLNKIIDTFLRRKWSDVVCNSSKHIFSSWAVSGSPSNLINKQHAGRWLNIKLARIAIQSAFNEYHHTLEDRSWTLKLSISLHSTGRLIACLKDKRRVHLAPVLDFLGHYRSGVLSGMSQPLGLSRQCLRAKLSLGRAANQHTIGLRVCNPIVCLRIENYIDRNLMSFTEPECNSWQ